MPKLKRLKLWNEVKELIWQHGLFEGHKFNMSDLTKVMQYVIEHCAKIAEATHSAAKSSNPTECCYWAMAQRAIANAVREGQENRFERRGL